MTVRQKAAFVSAACLVAFTRLFAISLTLWDWDETLFGLGVGDFNIASHHPQPPGFPVFTWLAKVAHLVVPSNFGAVQTVTVVSSLFIFPAGYFAARSFGLSFESGMVTATLLSFLPNVWFYGGTGFSDVPALVLEPRISIALDDHSEFFEARERFITRLVDVPAGDEGHRLTIATTQTANPAKLHKSQDSRELGLQVLSIGYLRR